MRIAAALLSLGVIASPARAADPLSSLHFLVGTWSCSYAAGTTRGRYTAAFSYDMAGNWLREQDSWTGGGGDLGMFTYERGRGWTVVILEQDRTTTIMRATGDNPSYIVYRSVYPDASMTDVFDRTSPTRYTLNFTQSANGKMVKSIDICVKSVR
jgi:hypothetical protein